MKKVSIVLVSAVLALSLCVSCSGAPLFTADDFVPVVQAPEEQRGELLTVQNPEDVKTETDPVLNRPVTKGLTVQDAINAIVQRHEEGCDMIAAPEGGYGFVATGLGTYRKDLQNITAKRIAQRNAYIQAFMQAKIQMSGLVSGMAVEGFTNFDQQVTAEDSDTEARRSSTSQTSESVRTSTAAVLKGYVTYNVFDDFKNGLVYVTIVSTPKTRGSTNRVTSTTIDAETINGGLNTVLAEIQSGLVPLVGGRVVEVPATGEVAFVGFGSAVVRQEKNPALRAQMLRVAQSSAGLRAADALCGIIIGDSTKGETKLDEQTKEAMTSYENAEAADPMKELATSGDVAEAEQAQNEFRNNMQFSQTIESARRGVLPPGVIRRAWLDDEGAFAYSLAVYIPSVSQGAAKSGKDMREAQIVKPVETEDNEGYGAGGNSEGSSESQTPDYKDSGKLRRGASGTVNQSL